MKIAVIGGTGRMGKALAFQLSKRNRVIIGSRDAARAEKVAKGIEGAAGADYSDASRDAEVAVFSIPYSAMGTAATLKEKLSGKLVISVINPMKADGGLLQFALEEGSAAEELARMLPRSRVASAFNNVSSLFFEKDQVVPMDVLVAADSKGTYAEAAEVVRSIRNLRPLYAGPLAQSRTIEMITPLVLNLARLNGTGSLTTRFVSTKDAA